MFAQSSFLKSFEQVGGKAFSITTDPIHPRILKTSSSLSTIVYFDNYLNPLFGLDLKIGVDNPGDVFRKSRAITSDKLGNVYYLLNWENLGNDAAIIKIDPNGRVIWQRTISGISFGILLKLQLIANETKLRASGVGIASEKLSYLVTVELDSAGNLIQSSSFRGGGENDAYYWYGSSLSYDMGAIHTGYSANSNDYEHGILCVAKMDSNLNLVWNKSYTVTKTNHPGGNLTEKRGSRFAESDPSCQNGGGLELGTLSTWARGYLHNLGIQSARLRGGEPHGSPSESRHSRPPRMDREHQ